MAGLWTDYLWPVIVIGAEGVLRLRLLLIVTAAVLYAERNSCGAVQLRRGPDCAGSLNLSAIVEAQASRWGLLGWYWLRLLPMFVIFLVSGLAETNRPPFDLVEAESELVAGYAVEYSSTPYMLFFLGEYIAILTMCAMATILFLGGWLPPFPVAPFTWIPGVVWFTLKCLFMFFLFAMVKAIVPRYRYDQLMRLGWKVFLPLSLAMVAIVAGVLQYSALIAK